MAEHDFDAGYAQAIKEVVDALPSLYNKPLTSFSRPLRPDEYEGRSARNGSRFLRWHELGPKRQEQLRTDFESRFSAPSPGPEGEGEQ